MSGKRAWLAAVSLSASIFALAGLAQAEGTTTRASSKAVAANGPVVKACDLRGNALGKVVEKGPGKWKLYDTAPGSMAPRDFYLTGFTDRCPRRITGTVAMFGSVELYELLHYGPVGMKPSAASTDRAYQVARSRACGAPAKPCTKRGLKKLEKSVVFLDVYPSSGSPARVQLLMSRGRLSAVAQK